MKYTADTIHQIVMMRALRKYDESNVDADSPVYEREFIEAVNDFLFDLDFDGFRGASRQLHARHKREAKLLAKSPDRKKRYHELITTR